MKFPPIGLKRRIISVAGYIVHNDDRRLEVILQSHFRPVKVQVSICLLGQRLSLQQKPSHGPMDHLRLRPDGQ
jgi:hypothetical protein